MPYNQKSRDATYKYRAEKNARTSLDLSKTKKERWRAAADAMGEPLNSYISAAVEARIAAVFPGGVPEGETVPNPGEHSEPVFSCVSCDPFAPADGPEGSESNTGTMASSSGDAESAGEGEQSEGD